MPVSHHVKDNLPEASGDEVIYSIAIGHSEYDDDFLKCCHRLKSPKVIFLDRTNLRFRESHNDLVAEFLDHHHLIGRFRHVFRLEPEHPLAEGLPATVPIYGESPIVTPLRVEAGMEVLVSLDTIPVIAKRSRDLLIGADPWQLGVPSVPMLYKILSNWLKHEVGLSHRILTPCAVIRLDDLPTTAEQLKTVSPSRKLDRQRAKTIRRLRNFGRRCGARFTMMYSSHYHGPEGGYKTVSSAMPQAIRELQLGVGESIFEIGSHGMVHLRSDSSDPTSSDPREFLDLNEEETAAHLRACDNEIRRLFGTRPKSFVAPAWGYRPGITKRIAAACYPIIVDSSQHVESGACDVFLADGSEGDYFNAVETFRSGDRMLTYSNPDFWRCYAAAGIPIHYMQHTDTNWQILRKTMKEISCRDSGFTALSRRVLSVIDDTRRPRFLRAAYAGGLLLINLRYKPESWRLLWAALTRHSIYAFSRSMKMAGYKFVTLAGFKGLAQCDAPGANRVTVESIRSGLHLRLS